MNTSTGERSAVNGEPVVFSSLTVVRKISELLEERDQRLVEAQGRWGATDWEWRCDWRRRMSLVIEELTTLQTNRRDRQREQLLAGMAAVERERQAALG